MGLDMYLYKAKRINGATINDIVKAEEYFSWLLRPSKYTNCSMKSWCGVDKKDVDMKVVDDYRNELKTRYYAWDYDHEYGNLALKDNIAYWRKANAIHKWFVKNVQDGEDNCEMYEVEKEQLENLLLDCKRSINDPVVAKELLPTCSGFFFGGTDYDEWYTESLKYTIEVATKILETTDFEKEVVAYRASW